LKHILSATIFAYSQKEMKPKTSLHLYVKQGVAFKQVGLYKRFDYIVDRIQENSKITL